MVDQILDGHAIQTKYNILTPNPWFNNRQSSFLAEFAFEFLTLFFISPCRV